MADLPEATVTVSDEAGSFAGQDEYVTVFAAVSQNADCKPRVFGSTKALLDTHAYSQGAAYVAKHISRTRKPVIFCGLPIAVEGTIGRENDEGVTGTCNITVAAAASGVLEEVNDAYLTVIKGGTVGTDQIVFDLYADGRTKKRVRLGTNESYAIPFLGIVLNFGAGTLVAGDEFSFSTTAPKWDSAGLAAARQFLKAQQKLSRTWVIIGDLEDKDEADDVLTEVNGYETENKRFVFARVNVRDRTPLATMSTTRVKMTGSPNITFTEVGATGDTITRSSGSFIDDGFAVGMAIDTEHSVSNNFTKAKITVVTDTALTLDTQDVTNEGPVAGVSITGSYGVTFAEVGGTGDTIARSGGSFLADGFRAGDVVTVAGTASNNVSGALAAVSASTLTFGTTDLAAEFIGSKDITITKGETMSAWVAEMDAEFGDVDDEPRISLGLGRARTICPITQWRFRRPIMWAASIREYEHDLHVPTWQKELGPLSGWDIRDEEDNIVEYEETSVGGALAARFTCARIWENGPNGVFIALDLTRAPEASLRSRTHNMAVINLFCSVLQAETEGLIGKTPELNDDGTGLEKDLQAYEAKVNKTVDVNLLQDKKNEGKRASMARWEASRTDPLNVTGATLTGTGFIELDGTIEKVNTAVAVQTAGGG